MTATLTVSVSSVLASPARVGRVARPTAPTVTATTPTSRPTLAAKPAKALPTAPDPASEVERVLRAEMLEFANGLGWSGCFAMRGRFLNKVSNLPSEIRAFLVVYASGQLDEQMVREGLALALTWEKLPEREREVAAAVAAHARLMKQISRPTSLPPLPPVDQTGAVVGYIEPKQRRGLDPAAVEATRVELWAEFGRQSATFRNKARKSPWYLLVSTLIPAEATPKEISARNKANKALRAALTEEAARLERKAQEAAAAATAPTVVEVSTDTTTAPRRDWREDLMIRLAAVCEHPGFDGLPSYDKHMVTTVSRTSRESLERVVSYLEGKLGPAE